MKGEINLNKKVKGVKRVSASEPRLDDFTKADNIRLSRAGKICLENFKKTVGTDGTVTILTKRVYKRPTKTNIRLVREAGYAVDLV